MQMKILIPHSHSLGPLCSLSLPCFRHCHDSARAGRLLMACQELCFVEGIHFKSPGAHSDLAITISLSPAAPADKRPFKWAPHSLSLMETRFTSDQRPKVAAMGPAVATWGFSSAASCRGTRRSLGTGMREVTLTFAPLHTGSMDSPWKLRSFWNPTKSF